MVGKTWVYDPHSGGIKIPDKVKVGIRQRILKHAEAHYAGKYLRIEVRFRSQFCYIDAYTEPHLIRERTMESTVGYQASRT